MNKELTPMQELITALTENGLISINQTLIDGALKQEKQVIEDAFLDGYCTNENENITSQDYYNNKFNNK